MSPHRLRTPGDLVRRLPLRPQRDEEPADLRGRRLAAHDLAHHVARLVAPDVVPVEQRLDRSLDHDDGVLGWSHLRTITPCLTSSPVSLLLVRSTTRWCRTFSVTRRTLRRALVGARMSSGSIRSARPTTAGGHGFRSSWDRRASSPCVGRSNRRFPIRSDGGRPVSGGTRWPPHITSRWTLSKRGCRDISLRSACRRDRPRLAGDATAASARGDRGCRLPRPLGQSRRGPWSARVVPDDVWLWLMACQWRRLDQEEPFVGSAGEVGDELGSRLLAARLVRDAMRLCFLQERCYAPYSKWIGSAFQKLDAARTLTEPMEAAVSARDVVAREAALVSVSEELARRHNVLGLTTPQEPTARPFHSRPYRVLGSQRFVDACLERVSDPLLRSLRSSARSTSGSTRPTSSASRWRSRHVRAAYDSWVDQR